MSDNHNFRKKYLMPMAYGAVMVMAVWSATGLIKTMGPNMGSQTISLENLEPAAGEEIIQAKVSETELVGAPELPAIPSDSTLENAGPTDAEEAPPLRISSDKPEVIKLDRDAVNVLVGSDETLRAVPDTNRTIVLIPKKPGATYFRAIDADGKVIMQRHVIVGSTEKNSKYIRIRRACAGDDTKCKEFSVYYCPDMCHEVNVVQQGGQTTNAPDVAPSIPSTNDQNDGVAPSQTSAPAAQ